MPNLGPEYVTLGHALRVLRSRAGLTQVQAAEAVKVRAQSISQVERAERGMRWGTLLQLLDAYGVDLAALASRSSAWKPTSPPVTLASCSQGPKIR